MKVKTQEKFLKQIDQNMIDKRFGKKRRSVILNNITKRIAEDGTYSAIFEKIDYNRLPDEENLTTEKNWEEVVAESKLVEDDRREQSIIDLQSYYDNIQKKLGMRFFPEEEIVEPINKRFLYGRTALHQAVVDKEYKEVERLLKKGASQLVSDNNGRTPYQVAQLNNDCRMKILLNKFIVDM